jgi:hypothetical protein
MTIVEITAFQMMNSRNRHPRNLDLRTSGFAKKNILNIPHLQHHLHPFNTP